MSEYTAKKTFSFSKENQDLLDYINNQYNQSQFVADAIRFYIDYKYILNDDVVSKKKYDELEMQYKASQIALETIVKTIGKPVIEEVSQDKDKPKSDLENEDIKDKVNRNLDKLKSIIDS